MLFDLQNYSTKNHSNLNCVVYFYKNEYRVSTKTETLTEADTQMLIFG